MAEQFIRDPCHQVGAGVDFELVSNSLTFECRNPQLSSVAIWHLALAGKLGINIQFPSKDEIKNRTYPYSTSSWHADRCCHPKVR